MWVTYHIIIGAIIALLYFYLSGDFNSAALFFLVNFLVDFDHPMGMAILDRTINVPKIFNTLKEIHFKGLKKYEERLFCIFHTIEFIALLSVICLFIPTLFPALFAVAFHVIIDIITVGKNKNKRIFFLTFFIIKYLRGGYKKGI